jgi:C4-dicarboxylate transporter DctM subunit
MSPIIVGIIGFVVFFILLALGVPLGVGLAFVGFAGVWYILSGSAAIACVAFQPFLTAADYSLATLPLFLFMAQIVLYSGLTDDLYNLAAKWLGHQPGGIAMATVGACGIFSAISSSSPATAATIGSVALPQLKKYKYDPALATGSISAGGTLGILIPPSGMLIFYGVLTETSIGKLFIAGIVPGALQAIFYVILIYILCRRNPSFGPRGPSFSFREKVAAFKSCGEVIALILLVLGGLMIGWFTSTEAGAVGVCGAILLSLVRRRLNWQKFRQAAFDTLKITGMIYFILIGAMLFKYFTAVSTIAPRLSEFVGGLPLPPLAIMGCILLSYIILGTAMEEASMMAVTIPIFFPLVVALGFDPIWFGIIVVRMMQMAMISPPLGINMFVIQGMSKEPMSTVYRGVVPFLFADVVHVALLLFVPAVAMFLPSLWMG